MEEEERVNGHMHIMSELDVPDGFVVNKFIQRLITKHTLGVAKLLSWTSNNSFQKYAKFLITEDKTSKHIFESCKKIHTRFQNMWYNVLLVNMNGMGCGKTARSYEDQILAAIDLKRSGENIRLYYHYEPTQDNSLLKKYEKWFDGIKIYTLMGHYVQDCYPAFNWCNKNNKNVILHTSPESPSYYKGKKKELKRRIKEGKYKPYKSNWFTSKKTLCRNFTNPLYYRDMLVDYPGVNFDFAHLYGKEELKKHMEGKNSFASVLLFWLRIYKNAYADISYTCSDDEYQGYLYSLMKSETLSGKFLFGSDYPMSLTTIDSEKAFTFHLMKNIGRKNFNKISIDNHKSFNYGS